MKKNIILLFLLVLLLISCNDKKDSIGIIDSIDDINIEEDDVNNSVIPKEKRYISEILKGNNLYRSDYTVVSSKVKISNPLKLYKIYKTYNGEECINETDEIIEAGFIDIIGKHVYGNKNEYLLIDIDEGQWRGWINKNYCIDFEGIYFNYLPNMESDFTITDNDQYLVFNSNFTLSEFKEAKPIIIEKSGDIFLELNKKDLLRENTIFENDPAFNEYDYYEMKFMGYESDYSKFWWAIGIDYFVTAIIYYDTKTELWNRVKAGYLWRDFEFNANTELLAYVNSYDLDRMGVERKNIEDDFFYILRVYDYKNESIYTISDGIEKKFNPTWNSDYKLICKLNNDSKIEYDIDIEENTDITGEINDTNVHLRNSPNIDSIIIENLQPQDKVMIIGKSDEVSKIGDSENYWYKVKSSKKYIGYIYGDFIDL